MKLKLQIFPGKGWNDLTIFERVLNFKKYETARRINNDKAINDRAEVRSDELPGLLETYSNRSRKTRGVDKRDVRRTERLGGVYVKKMTTNSVQFIFTTI